MVERIIAGPITQIVFDRKALRLLHAEGIFSIEELTNCRDTQILIIPGLGRKTFKKIENALSLNGLKFAKEEYPSAYSISSEDIERRFRVIKALTGK